MGFSENHISESHLKNYNKLTGYLNLALDTRDVLFALCRDCDDLGFYRGNAWQLHMRPRNLPSTHAPNPPGLLEMAQEALAELEELRIISWKQYQETIFHPPEMRDGIQIADWESEEDLQFMELGIGERSTSKEVRLNSPQIKLLCHIIELAKKLGVSKASLCQEWGVARRQIYYYLRGDKMPSIRTYRSMLTTGYRLESLEAEKHVT